MATSKDIAASLIRDGIDPDSGKSFVENKLNEQSESHGDVSSRSPLGGETNSLSAIANSPGIQGILGLGDAPRELMSNIAEKLYGKDFKFNPAGQGDAYDAGKMAGNVGTFVAGGEALEGANAAMKGVPALGKIAGLLEGQGARGVARRGVGSAMYGAASNPDDMAEGAGLGAGLSVAADTIIPGLGRLTKAGIDYVRPQKYASEAAGKIKDMYSELMNKFSQQYAPTTGKFGNYRLGINNSNYASVFPQTAERFAPAVEKLHDEYLAKPTLRNAHELQSQIGYEIRRLENLAKGRKPLDQNERRDLRAMKKTQKALQTDIDNFFNIRSPNLATSYKETQKQYGEEVSPFRGKMHRISTGAEANPKAKAFSDMLGASENPAMQQLGVGLDRRRLAQNIAMPAIGGVLGSLGGSNFGDMGAILGGIAGGGAGLRGAEVGELLPKVLTPQMKAAMTQYLKKLYSPAKKGIIPNILSGNTGE